MTHLQQLQSALIQRIQQIKDAELLQALSVLLEKKESEVYELQDWQTQLLDKADEELARGEVVSNEEVFAQSTKWLKEQENK